MPKSKMTKTTERKELLNTYGCQMTECWDYLDHGYEIKRVEQELSRVFKKMVKSGLRAREVRKEILSVVREGGSDGWATVTDLQVFKRVFKKHFKEELEFGL